LPYFSLPNLLAQEQLVPEFLQHQVIPEKLGVAILQLCEKGAQVEVLKKRFTDLHHSLRLNAKNGAATAVLSIIRD
jgi:lipid-A-disaccharide synthase